MKKMIIILAVMFFPLFIFGKGKIIHSLDYYICHTELRHSLNKYVIPFLIKGNYNSSEKGLDVTFKSYFSAIYIFVSVINKKELLWNDNIIGYTNIAGYTCILSGNNYNQLIKRSFLNWPQIMFFYNLDSIELVHDGTIEWLFRLDEDKIKFIRFNSEW